MRVLVATPYFYDSNHKEFTTTSSGFGYMVKDILDAIADQNEVYVFTHQFSEGYYERYKVVKHTKKDVIRNIRFADIKSGVKDFIKMRKNINTALHYLYYQLDKGAFIKSINEIRPDIVHIHGLTYQTRPFIEVCYELHLPFLVTLHGLNGISDTVLLPQVEKIYEKESLIKFAKNNIPVTVVSSGIKKKIKTFYGISDENIKVILNGTKIGIEKLSERKKDTYNIICIGTICARKNQTQLVDCVAELPSRYKERIKVIFVGQDFNEVSLGEYIYNKDVQSIAEWKGFIPREEMSNLWMQTDLNVVMSKEEGFGLSMIEGFANGVPTLTFSDLDAVEDIYNADSVELFVSRSNEDVILGIINCINREFDKEKILCWGKNFSMTAIGDQYSKFYKEVKGIE